MLTPRPYAKEPHRIRLSLLIVCLVLTVLWGFWVFMDYGKWRLIYQEMTESESQKTLLNAESSAGELVGDADVIELRRQVTVLERAAQVDRIEQNQIRDMMTELEDEKQALQEELEFYKYVLISSKDNKGLKLQALRIKSLNDKQRYHYELFLTRIAKGGRVSGGKVKVSLHGQGASGVEDLSLSELLDNDSKLTYKIKHFKRLSGVFVLPENFVPETVTVTIEPSEAGSKPIEMVYPWSEIVS